MGKACKEQPANKWVELVNCSVGHLEAFPDKCYVILQLIGTIHKLGRKQSIVNTVPRAVSTTLYFLRNTQIGAISYNVHN